MSTYQIHLVLEALVQIHSFDELAARDPITSFLVRKVGLCPDEAKVLVAGALELKKVRGKIGAFVAGENYMQ